MTATPVSLFGTEAEDDIATRFAAFDAAHPEVGQAMARIALRRLDAGARRISVKWLAEVLRTDPEIALHHGEKFKIDNSLTALYARKLVNDYPELRAVIHLRMRKL